MKHLCLYGEEHIAKIIIIILYLLRKICSHQSNSKMIGGNKLFGHYSR